MDHPIVRAVWSGAVCMVNPFRCKILHKKASLAVLSDERNAGRFGTRKSAGPSRATSRGPAWWRSGTPLTRANRSIWCRGSERHQDQLVLKPNDEYGGAGIVLGWEVDDGTWASAIRGAGRAHIVQQRIALPEESFPSWVDGRLVHADRIVDTAPFFCGGAGRGMLTRISHGGAGQRHRGRRIHRPTFVVERRS